MDNIVIIRPSTRFVMLRIIGELFMVETIYALAIVTYLIIRPGQTFDRGFILLLWVVHTVKFVVLAFLIADVIIRFLGTRYYITKQHLIVSRGIITDDEKVYDLAQLRKISAFQDYAGKRFNYGSVDLLLGARGFEEHVILVNIAHPKQVIKEVEHYLGATEK